MKLSQIIILNSLIVAIKTGGDNITPQARGGAGKRALFSEDMTQYQVLEVKPLHFVPIQHAQHHF